MKKIFKIIGIVLLVLIVGLIAAPFLFRGPLEDLLKRSINENINATVAWEDFDLTLFSSFPDAAVKVNNFTVVNVPPQGITSCMLSMSEFLSIINVSHGPSPVSHASQ